jgi:hypothetical protein
MIRTAFAFALVALVFAAITQTTHAAPIAPLPGASAAAKGDVTQVRYCWRGRWGHLHCRGW